MAIKKVYIGSVGPFLFDDADLINDQDGDFAGQYQKALTTDGSLASDVAVGIFDTNQSNVLDLKWNENDTVDRVLNFLVGGADRSITLSGNPTLADWFDQAVKVASTPTFAGVNVSAVIRGTASLWWHAYCVDAVNISPGASAATWTDADANHLAGYQLNAAAEYLYLTASVHSDWDAASDIEIKVTFEILAAGANATDTVDVKARCYYKGTGDIATKTQSPETAVVVGAAAQYTQFVATILIDHDLASNVVDVGDKMSIRLNLETDTSEVDNILVSLVDFRYKTAKMNPEV